VNGAGARIGVGAPSGRLVVACSWCRGSVSARDQQVLRGRGTSGHLVQIILSRFSHPAPFASWPWCCSSGFYALAFARVYVVMRGLRHSTLTVPSLDEGLPH